MLELKNISKRFPDGTAPLDGVDLEIPNGQLVVILGPSGSGKTTLIRCINGILKPDTGSVTFVTGNQTLTTGRSLRAQMGVVFQDFNLVANLSGLNNVLTGLLFSSNKFLSLFYIFTKKQKLSALEWLSRVGLLSKAYSRVSTLSGGQQQRVGIARALIKKPTILLADEPVASLDPLIARDVMTLIREISKEFGITVICSLHQVDLALEFADRIVGLRDGKVVIDSEPKNLTAADIKSIYEDTTKGLAFGAFNTNA